MNVYRPGFEDECKWKRSLIGFGNKELVVQGRLKVKVGAPPHTHTHYCRIIDVLPEGFPQE